MKYFHIFFKYVIEILSIVKSGISDNELEDVLSLDDKVLNKIYEDQIPEVRRVPAILVMKIKKEILSYLECIEADGAHVFRWSHKQFRDATLARYFRRPEVEWSTLIGSDPSRYSALIGGNLLFWCKGRHNNTPQGK